MNVDEDRAIVSEARRIAGKQVGVILSGGNVDLENPTVGAGMGEPSLLVNHHIQWYI